MEQDCTDGSQPPRRAGGSACRVLHAARCGPARRCTAMEGQRTACAAKPSGEERGARGKPGLSARHVVSRVQSETERTGDAPGLCCGWGAAHYCVCRGHRHLGLAGDSCMNSVRREQVQRGEVAAKISCSA